MVNLLLLPADISGGRESGERFEAPERPNREAATAAWKSFREDAAWTKARTESEKNGKLTAKTASVFLQATDFSKVK